MSGSTDRKPHLTELIVDAHDLAKSYVMGQSEVEALKGVSLQVARGQALAIMGRSGSGKSTLMHLLGCLDRPTRGQYVLNGFDVSTLHDIDLSLIRATQIGFVFQSFNLIPQYTVAENVQIPFLYQSQRRTDIQERTEWALKKVGLSHRIDHRPSQLSGGEMQRVAIARALAIDPVLILADEPTGNLDSDNGKAILTLFHELKEQGVTLIIVTHDESVGRQWDRLIRMRDGRIESEC